MKVKLLNDLKDAYGEIYYSEGDIVDIYERTIYTENDNMTVGHIKKFPFMCGGFYINKDHFKNIRKKKKFRS